MATAADANSSSEKLLFDENATDLWDGVRALWTAIDKGRRDWNVPAYNGGMFSSDPEVDAIGASLAGLELTNAEFGPALVGLLVDESNDGRLGPVDFASLDVREFGTIYEGLLESSLAVATVDLTTGKKDTWVPAGPKDEKKVREGRVYLHNKSGARKASGSYFTKPFAVNHLLDHGLEAALDDHIARLQRLLDEGDEVAAAGAFFDFRCADLAMGSGHFLVAAVDHIERRLSKFLVVHRIAGVHDELARLQAAAEKNLAEAGIASEGVDTTALLRRQVARRCIYGVDLNPTAVELARLALWLHTFVRGLPLTSLNHGLVRGNSLTGIATLDEATDVLDPDQGSGAVSFVRLAILEALEEAGTALKRFADTSEATAAEVKAARVAHREAQEAVASTKTLFDFAVAVRLGFAHLPESAFDVSALADAAKRSGATTVATEVHALHFPLVFPEVFLRERPGFDCILGNPPWQEATLEELAFWARHFPGMRSKTTAEKKKMMERLRRDRPDLRGDYERELAGEARTRAALIAGPFPGMGTGDPDLYKAFIWRFWALIRKDGRIAVVLPRQALAAAGSAPWRQQVLAHGRFDLTLLVNNAKWVFSEVHPQYTVSLTVITKGDDHAGTVRLSGPFASLAQFEQGVRSGAGASVDAEDLRSWTEHASVPLVPTLEALGVFLKLRAHPRFDADREWAARPVTELHATNEKKEMLIGVEPDGRRWPVYKGESFDLWNPDTGTYYAAADPKHITEYLLAKRTRQQRLARSAFSAFSAKWAADPETLPCLRPRIAFRDITRATDTRTVRAALVPSSVVITNKGPYLLWSRGDQRDEAFLLGVLSSLPLDWYARRIVELGLNFHTFNAFPIPVADRNDASRQRVEHIAGRLAAVDDRYAEWADAVGVPVGSVTDPGEKDDLIAEMDAAVAHLYGLDEADIEVILSTFHVGWDYKPRLTAVLNHYLSIA